MNWKSCVFAVFLLGSVPHVKAGDDPWGPSRMGKIECVQPDFDNKTCRSMASYVWSGDNAAISEDISILEGTNDIVVKVRTEITRDGSKMCFIIGGDIIAKARFERAETLVPEDELGNLRSVLVQRYAALEGRKPCIDISPYGPVFVVQLTVDGVEYPEAATRLAWVDPKDGFKLAHE